MLCTLHLQIRVLTGRNCPSGKKHVSKVTKKQGDVPPVIFIKIIFIPYPVRYL